MFGLRLKFETFVSAYDKVTQCVHESLLWHLVASSPVWARGRCRISPPRFLAECCKRQLNQVSLVLLYFSLSAFSDLYWVCLSVFSCTVLFVSISQVIGCEDRLRNDLYCVGWGVKLYSNQKTVASIAVSAAAFCMLLLSLQLWLCHVWKYGPGRSCNLGGLLVSSAPLLLTTTFVI